MSDAPDDQVGQTETSSTESSTDQARRKFREALEKKNARSGGHPDSHPTGGSTLKGSNGKRKREFRRKSG